MDKWTLEKDYQQFCQCHGRDMTVAPEEQVGLTASQAQWLDAHIESYRQLILAQMEKGQYIMASSPVVDDTPSPHLSSGMHNNEASPIRQPH